MARASTVVSDITSAKLIADGHIDLGFVAALLRPLRKVPDVARGPLALNAIEPFR